MAQQIAVEIVELYHCAEYAKYLLAGSVALVHVCGGHALSGRLWRSRVGGRDSLVQAHALTPAAC